MEHFPGNKNTLNRLTSPSAYLAYTSPEAESLENQIERLNRAIELMVQDSPPADENESFAQLDFTQSLSTASIGKIKRKSSGGLESVIRLSEIRPLAYEDEEVPQSLSRALMVCEDFRSSEYRRSAQSLETENYQKLVEEICTVLEGELGATLPSFSVKGLVEGIKCLMHKEMTVTLFELYKLRSDVTKIAELAEEGLCFRGKITVGSYSFELDVVDTQPQMNAKQFLANLLRGEQFARRTDKDAYIASLERQLKRATKDSELPSAITEYGDHLASSMQTSFNSFYKNSLYDAEFYCPTLQQFAADDRASNPVLMQVELRQLINTKRDHTALKAKLEWEYSEVSFIRNSFKLKENELKTNKEFLSKQKSLLRERNVQLEKLRDKFEREVQDFEESKQDQRKEQEAQRQQIFRVKKEISEITGNKNPSDSRGVSDLELQSLRTEISHLESSLPTANAQEKEQLVTQLTHKRTQLSNLRSSRAISHALNTSISLKNIINKVEHGLDRKSKFFQGKRAHYGGSQCSSPRPISINLYSSRPPSLNSSFTEDQKSVQEEPVVSPTALRPPIRRNKDENLLLKEISLIKTRLTAKEEDILKYEKSLQTGWMAVPGTEELIPLIQKEQAKIQKQNQQISHWLDHIDRDKLDIARTKKSLSEREAALQESTTALYTRKLQIDTKLSCLIECLF